MSTGDELVEALGGIDLWRIAVKPGKPFAFGNVLGKPFLGVPGNPVSVLVTTSQDHDRDQPTCYILRRK